LLRREMDGLVNVNVQSGDTSGNRKVSASVFGMAQSVVNLIHSVTRGSEDTTSVAYGGYSQGMENSTGPGLTPDAANQSAVGGATTSSTKMTFNGTEGTNSTVGLLSSSPSSKPTLTRTAADHGVGGKGTPTEGDPPSGRRDSKEIEDILQTITAMRCIMSNWRRSGQLWDATGPKRLPRDALSFFRDHDGHNSASESLGVTATESVWSYTGRDSIEAALLCSLLNEHHVRSSARKAWTSTDRSTNHQPTQDTIRRRTQLARMQRVAAAWKGMQCNAVQTDDVAAMG